jgi:catechol 2,3-dioxygenase-like lactoylglutathione lyase family enzyme
MATNLPGIYSTGNDYMNITHLDHLVLTVKDIDLSIRFYESVMGMSVETFAEGRQALIFGSQKINLHEHGNEFEPKAQTPFPGSADLCFITDTDLMLAIPHVQAQGVTILEGPVERTGAKQKLLSFYFRDPDGNLIEVANEIGEK